MNSRFIPYASTPGRLTAQLFSDAIVAVWSFLWILVGVAVHSAVSTIADVGRQVQGGASGVAGSLNSAGHSADDIPLVGGAVSGPLKAAGKAALDIAGAGHNLDSTASWLAIVLAMAVAAPPTLGAVVPWLVLRIRFVRRKLTVGALAATPAGAQLLALRALANRPLARLTAITPDPVGAWRAGDPHAIHGLAAIELRSAGMAVRTR
jgi:hypothetical protein